MAAHAAMEEAVKTFVASCQRCGVTLRISDDAEATGFKGSLSDSFLVVPETERPVLALDGACHRVPLPPLASTMRLEQLLCLASGQAEADHPVCEECLEAVIAEAQRRVQQAEDECEAFREAQARLEATAALEDMGEDEARLETELLAELAQIAEEEQGLSEELAQQSRLEEKLRGQEEQLWLATAEYQLDLEETEEERAAATVAIQHAQNELRRLRRSNVLNDMFHINQEGPFGTINRFRIGRLQEQPVPWDEINAAWGQACLLLDALVRKCGVPLPQYRLIPRGSYSQIKKDTDVLDLHSSDGGIVRFFSDRRFDQAMSAFLGCLKEVTRFLQRDPTMRLPFRIDGDKVGGFSVRQQFNQDERWTKSLKFMLTDLKWIIAFVESREFGATQSSVESRA